MYSSVIIGAGFSGICLGIKLKERGIDDFLILEKATGLGGTWRDNTYPGAECDIPSALYSYSFEPYPYWEYKWSHQQQILQYLNFCANKYDINEHILYEKELQSARWNMEKGYWEITTKDEQRFNARTFITAIGQLHHPSIPSISGQETFKGPAFHSARWNHDVSLKDKRIGVIGNAASAIQFIPQIVPDAKQVYIFQRSANWMIPKLDRAYKNWEKRLVRYCPFLLRLYRFRLWLLGGGLYFLMQSGNQWLRRYYESKSIKYIKEHIKDPDEIKKLTPDYPMGAKRVLISDDYYEAVAKDNCSIITNGIQQIHENGIQDEKGNNYQLDVLIYATGFKTNPFLSGIDIVGEKMQHITDVWKDGPRNYLGMLVSGFPNMFMMYGPNTNLGHNSIIIMSEAQADYISKSIEMLDQQNWKSMDVKSAIIEKYYKEIQDRLKNMIWSKIDNSWYKSSSGNIPNNWPGRTMEYARRTRNVKVSDFNIVKW